MEAFEGDEGMIVHGVFHNDLLIFSEVMIYAIYEKENLADSYMREMQGYYPDETYSVREIELDVEVAQGDSYKEESEG